MRFGFEMHRIWNEARSIPYQDRFMLCLGFIELRLHKFWRGDDDRAPHDHPWWFFTFPFASYLELIPKAGETGYFEEDRDWWAYETQVVKAFRFHYRAPNFKHIVVRKIDQLDYHLRGINISNSKLLSAVASKDDSFWTFVICGRKVQQWGFWKTPYTFVPHEDWHG